jgi:superfamily II helicase
MLNMVNKIAISISKELDTALSKISADKTLSKSRLIEICLRENPEIMKTINSYELKNATVCELCQDKFTAEDIKIDTPKYGVICKECWSNRAATLAISKPIADV